MASDIIELWKASA